MVTITNNGKRTILCEPHDYKLFNGLERDLADYARKWKGGGWDDLKVNVDYAEGTSIYISRAELTPLGKPETSQLIIDSTHIENTSDETINVDVSLEGTIETTLSASITDSFSANISEKIGGDIEIFSAEVQLGMTMSYSETTTETEKKSITYKKKVAVKVEPGKAYDCDLVVHVKRAKYKFEISADIEGPVRIQYPSRRDGHYYWIFGIASYMHNTDELLGTITNSYAIDSHIIVSNSEIK
ncbi:MAG: hypothetical protein F6J89_12505 [Symploca sp. SIO1C4]|uniref:Uncharacterized protein n=1 Tax=Symploca sp. SIO1C4 TaxID=2607765 RepID=A0A6B3NE67_9CYAN|nr:hypothetical protein [Symploca sp. SIO1C4]